MREISPPESMIHQGAKSYGDMRAMGNTHHSRIDGHWLYRAATPFDAGGRPEIVPTRVKLPSCPTEKALPVTESNACVRLGPAKFNSPS